jgi:hypothetical protein
MPKEQRAELLHALRALWPADVVETDEAVVLLSWQLATAAMAHYLTDEGSAARLLLYRQLVRHIETLRANGKLPAPTAAVFRANLDRARWSLRFALCAPPCALLTVKEHNRSVSSRVRLPPPFKHA